VSAALPPEDDKFESVIAVFVIVLALVMWMVYTGGAK